MSLTLDPRHLAQLKRFAAEAGVRPGEMAMRWIIERLDTESGRAPQPSASPGPVPQATPRPDLLARLERLSARIDALEARATAAPEAPVEAAAEAPMDARVDEPAEAPAAEAALPAQAHEPRAKKPKAAPSPPSEPRVPRRRNATEAQGERVGLHDEIAAVISERGPMSAGDLATAIVERGRYVAPRSTKPLDAATVNSRVSNPAYRGRFTRSDGRIGLTDAG